ncbi:MULTISPECIES: selenium metabolism-associated LysR family transcriptional regulator [Bacillus]|uniref:selenium metabolism-associated LysR family transcriptional regulator n=1 Tax=Bacillus TaxID=1386 RepID=UPI000C77F675|nr:MULTISPECIES: selenium metabolism-associated LysR family transcriptional regulator [Bacillus]PLR84710.1 LysR family transcriptional regulator [Bacillus sp. V33-4]RSK57591.1 LysR family transcriptional regulator [Bacillus canaveralius]
MDLHQLYVFTKVVEHKSFSKAADDIFLSQSTVSSHIHALERMLNVKLFDRVGRDSIVTPYGERLYEWALKILRLKDEALLDLNQGMKELRGVVRIAASSVPGQFMIPKMVKIFRTQYPEVTFHINQSPSKIVAEKVLNGSVDLGVLGEKYEDDKLHYIPLLKEKLVLITSTQFKIKDPVNMEDITKYPLVMRSSESGTNSILEKFLKKKQIPKDQLNIITYTDSGESLIQFVKQGIGISIISEIAAKEYVMNKMICLHEIDDLNDERYFYLVYNKNKTLSLISKLFIDEAGNLLE